MKSKLLIPCISAFSFGMCTTLTPQQQSDLRTVAIGAASGAAASVATQTASGGKVDASKVGVAAAQGAITALGTTSMPTK